MRDGNNKASVFTWLEFHFIKESVEMTEIPRLSAIRITFRYSRRDDLHEDAHLIVTNTLIANTNRIAKQTSDAICCKDWSFLVLVRREECKLFDFRSLLRI